MRKGRFDKSYWHGRYDENERQHAQQNMRKFALFHNVRRNRIVESYWHKEGLTEMTDNTRIRKS